MNRPYYKRIKVEMAGIEPASERFNPRISTCVDPPGSRSIPVEGQEPEGAIRSGPKALFRVARGLQHGTLTL